MWGDGDDFHKKFQFLEEKKLFILFFLTFYFLMLLFYYCSINFKRQSEHSGLHPDTSSLVYVCVVSIASDAKLRFTCVIFFFPINLSVVFYCSFVNVCLRFSMLLCR